MDYIPVLKPQVTLVNIDKIESVCVRLLANNIMGLRHVQICINYNKIIRLEEDETGVTATQCTRLLHPMNF